MDLRKWRQEYAQILMGNEKIDTEELVQQHNNTVDLLMAAVELLGEELNKRALCPANVVCVEEEKCTECCEKAAIHMIEQRAKEEK